MDLTLDELIEMFTKQAQAIHRNEEREIANETNKIRNRYGHKRKMLEQTIGILIKVREGKLALFEEGIK